jgi:hypothetical protein
MRLNTETTEHFPNPAQCDVQRICGPKFNTFGPASERLDEPGRFFQRDSWKAMTKRFPNEDESDRWEGME